MLVNLKWLNLSNLDRQPDIEKYAGFIAEILPKNCHVVYSDGRHIQFEESSPFFGKNDQKVRSWSIKCVVCLLS